MGRPFFRYWHLAEHRERLPYRSSTRSGHSPTVVQATALMPARNPSRTHLRKISRFLQACDSFATNSRSRCDQITIGVLVASWQGHLTRGGLVMRTAISIAAPPRRLRWQAAFTIKGYQTLSPVVWHHAFVSDTNMTNWRGGSELILRWPFGGSPGGKSS
jgi:hypothetical protein